ncbi:MAG TPA: glycosyltransferase family 4 protein [Candidatus Nanoarchaeia archaeon]|nr:glycosyltransferase family 4 protein [Candidatus Nanoarchaeia archaeon]
MKIYYLADIEERKYEGRSQTALALKEYLEGQGFEFVNHPAKADLIQIHSSGIAASFQAARLKLKYHKPVVYTIYSLSKTEPINHFRNHLAQRYYLRKRKTSFLLSYSAVIPLRWRGYNLKKMDCVVTPSYFVKRRLFNNTKLIRIGLDLQKFRPEPLDIKSNLRVPNLMVKSNPAVLTAGILKVGYFGHPSVYKGVLDFARASRAFPKYCQPYIHLSDLSPKMARNLRKINPRLNLSGYNDEMPQAYRSMDIIVLPYRSYLAGVANPLVLIEAMACGKAIITTNFSYLREIVQDSAVIIKPYSPRQIVKAVRLLENQALRQRLGQKARQIIEANFSQDKMFEEYRQLYLGLSRKSF